jgi:hypothetical protein
MAEPVDRLCSLTAIVALLCGIDSLFTAGNGKELTSTTVTPAIELSYSASARVVTEARARGDAHPSRQ